MGGGQSSYCNGTHPTDIGNAKDRIKTAQKKLIDNQKIIADKIKEYNELNDKLIKDIEAIKWQMETKIPNRAAAVKKKILDQSNTYENTNIKLYDATSTDYPFAGKLGQLEYANHLLQVELDAKKDKLNNLSTQTETNDLIINKLGVATGAYNAKSSNTLSNTIELYKDIYDFITVENNNISKDNVKYNELYSSDGSKIKETAVSTGYLKTVRFWMFFMYYILVLIVIYFVLFKNMNIYLKIVFVIILLAYPIYIYNFQYNFHKLWNTVYAYLRISVQKN